MPRKKDAPASVPTQAPEPGPAPKGMESHSQCGYILSKPALQINHMEVVDAIRLLHFTQGQILEALHGD